MRLMWRSGWSLGGQLLARAVAGGYISPKKLVLLAAPFQFIADADFNSGVTKAEFEVTRVNYIHNAKQMLSQFQPYMGYGDRNQQYVIRKLGQAGRDLEKWTVPGWMSWERQVAVSLTSGGFPETVSFTVKMTRL